MQCLDFNVANQEVIAFDFGNCCYHWYVADLAIALSTIVNHPERKTIKECILKGYESKMPLPNNLKEQLDLFVRLRAIYVYLSRLFLFGKHPTAAQRKQLEHFRKRIHQYNKFGF